MDEEAQKRNTDCVYFLASPLTCKKGNECEYRHSESARINPRDCWFWMSGNCLNPACSFRHPPLDGLPGAASGNSGAPSSASSQPTALASLPATVNANKPKVPCYFFNQGFCAKGDKCPYMHGILSGGSLASQKATKVTTAATDPQASGKQVANEAEKNIKDGKYSSPANVTNTIQSSEPKKLQPVNNIAATSNTFKAVQSSKPMTLQSNNFKAEQTGNSVGIHSNHVKAVHTNHTMAVQAPLAVIPNSQVRSQPPYSQSNRLNVEVDLPEMESARERTYSAPVPRSRVRHGQAPDDRLQNGMEHDEWLGESSPGFDVLVDNGPDQLSHHEDADYHPNHDIELGRGTITGRERNKKREFPRFDYDHPSMHERTGYSDAEYQYNHGPYDQYKHRGYDHVGRKQLNHFDDRATERSIVRERRSLSNEDDLEQNNIGDLRHHISKRRKFGTAKAVDNSPKRQHLDAQQGDFHHGHRLWDDEHRHHDVTYRDHSQQGLPQNNRRLHGRIQVDAGGFKRASSENADSDHEGNSERFRYKSSPGRRGRSDHYRSTYQGKERGRVLPEAAALPESRSSRSQNFKNNETRTDVVNFAGPKTLAQIKQEKNREQSEEPAPSIHSRLHGSVPNVSFKNEARLRQSLPLEEKKMRFGKVSHDLSDEQGFEGPKPLSDILKAKRRGSVENDDITGERSTEEPNQNNQGFSSGMNIKSADEENFAPMSEKEVEEGELPEGDDYAFEPTIDGRAEDFEASDVDTVMEHKAPAQGNGKLPDERNEPDDMVMNENIHSSGEEDIDVDHEDYDLEHSEHEENEEWQRNGNQMQEEEDEENYIEDDDEDDFAKKLGGIFS